MKQDPRFPNLFILNHPLIQHKLSHMRDRGTSTIIFPSAATHRPSKNTIRGRKRFRSSHN